MDTSLEQITSALRGLQLQQWDQMPDIELYMDQVITYLKRQLSVFVDQNEGLITPSIINNYVKAGLVPRPEKKRYARPQLSALTMACLLKGVMPMQSVKRLITRDGHLPDEEFYHEFTGMLNQVLAQEAEMLEELGEGSQDREQLLHLAMCFAMRANTDRYVADRLLNLLQPPEDKEKKKP